MSVHGFPPDGLPPGEAVRAQHAVQLPPVPHHVAFARDFVNDNLPAMDPGARDAVLLMTSELVTNAVIHARTTFDVGLTVGERSVVVTVFDRNVGGHREPSGPAMRDGGRGLVLVRELADTWSVHRPSGGGKTVWFRLDTGGPRQREGQDEAHDERDTT